MNRLDEFRKVALQAVLTYGDWTSPQAAAKYAEQCAQEMEALCRKAEESTTEEKKPLLG